MAAHAKPIWAGQDLRLDPQRLPQAVSYAVADAQDASFTITARGIVMQESSADAISAIARLMPLSAYRGVAARAMEDDEGRPTVTLELHHDDPSLCVPLLVAHDLEAVSSDWHRWAAVFKLPMLLIEADGKALTLEESLERMEGEVERAPRPTKHKFGVFHRRKLGVRLVVGGMDVIEASNSNDVAV